MLKKLMAVVLVGLLTIGSMAMMATAAVDFQTQYNLSFEQTIESDTVLLPDGWTIGANLSSDETTDKFAVASNEQTKEGTYSLKIKNTGIGTVNDRVWRVVSDLTAGAEYMVTGYVYVTAPMNNLGIMVFDGNTGASGANWVSGLSGATGILGEAKQTKEVWMPLTAYFTAPANGVVSLAVGAYNSGSTFGTAYFDKLAIYELGDGLSFENIKLEDDVLLPSDWTIGANLSSDEATNNFAVASDEQVKEGNYSLKIKHTAIGTVNDRVWRVVSDLTAGAEYMVTGYVYVTAPMNNLGIMVFDGNTGASGANWVSGLSAATGILGEAKQTKEVWMPLIAYFTAPENGVVSLAVGGFNSASTNGTAYFDDIAIYEVGDEADSENNLSFEKIQSAGTAFVPAEWTVGLSSDETSAAFAVASDDRARTGNYSLKVKATAINSSVYRPWTLVDGLTAGAAYMVTGYMNVTSPLYYAGFAIYEPNNGGAAGPWSGLTVANSILAEAKQIAAGSNKWIPVVTYFVAPADGAVSLAVIAQNVGNTTGTAYFDDITITKVADTVGFDVKVLDANFEEVTALNGQAKDVKLLVNGTNMTAADKNYTLIYATYSKDGDVTEMKSVALNAGTIPAKADAATVPGSINANAGACIDNIININIPAGQTFKVFIFDNMSTLSAAYVQELS